MCQLNDAREYGRADIVWPKSVTCLFHTISSNAKIYLHASKIEVHVNNIKWLKLIQKKISVLESCSEGTSI
jgi:hypothetical protein